MFSVRTFVRGVLTRQKREARYEILRAPRVRRFPNIRAFLETIRRDIRNHDETIKNCCMTVFIGYASYDMISEFREDALKRKNEEYKKLHREEINRTRVLPILDSKEEGKAATGEAEWAATGEAAWAATGEAEARQGSKAKAEDSEAEDNRRRRQFYLEFPIFLFLEAEREINTTAKLLKVSLL